MVEVLRSRAIFRLRTWLPEHASGAKPLALGGAELPREVGRTRAGPIRIACVAPGEWLIVTTRDRVGETIDLVESEASKQGLVLADVSDAYSTFEIRSPAARELLSKGCGLDLHPSEFPLGRCARTRFAQLAVVLECTGEDLFELTCGRSYERYLREWLDDAAMAVTASPTPPRTSRSHS